MICCRRSAALTSACLASLMLAGCNLSIDNPNSASSASGGGTQGSSGTGSAQYRVGGSITGLSQGGLVLASGSNSVTVAAGATSFTLPALLASGATYSVSVKMQPQGQSCVARNEAGIVAQANVTSVQVSCTLNTYTIGGTVTGLNAAGLVLVNGTDTLTVPAGSGAYRMPTQQPMGTPYTVTVQAQPTGLTCQVSNGSGTMPAAAVTDVAILCGQWTWMAGASSTGSAGSYGTLRTAGSSNAPPARSGAVSWQDASGRLWVFGGATSGGSLNDLWQYDPGTSEWTWMGGASAVNAAGQYGNKGTEASSNMPGARQGAAAWVDGSGNFWLFGGQGYDAAGTNGLLDDLWKYDTANGEWTWVAGESSAYAIGAMDPAAEPGARSGASGWRDANDNFWLFGGNGTAASGAAGATNDLWEYSAGAWTLVSGSQTPAMHGVYGTKGTAAASTTPGSRAGASGFVDGAGNLWLFGGQGYAAIGGSGLLNDLWKFSPSSMQWSWQGGWNTVNAAGVYGTQSTTDVALPGARYGATVSTDASGNPWLFGGTGYDGAGAQGMLGDLWEYQVSAARWIWMGGSQSRANTGEYGTQGTAAPTLAPGARAAGVAWMDGSGNFWLFGGLGLAMTQTPGTLNDLWQFAP